MLALLGAGSPRWPKRRFWPVATAATIAGMAYTIFSEWLNLVVRLSWAYSSLMPVVPWLGTGVSPLLQWAVLPPALMVWAHRNRARA